MAEDKQRLISLIKCEANIVHFLLYSLTSKAHEYFYNKKLRPVTQNRKNRLYTSPYVYCGRVERFFENEIDELNYKFRKKGKPFKVEMTCKDEIIELTEKEKNEDDEEIFKCILNFSFDIYYIFKSKNNIEYSISSSRIKNMKVIALYEKEKINNKIIPKLSLYNYGLVEKIELHKHIPYAYYGEKTILHFEGEDFEIVYSNHPWHIIINDYNYNSYMTYDSLEIDYFSERTISDE